MMPLHEISALARSADAAGSLVFLVNESPRTQQACGDVLRTIGSTVGVLHDFHADPGRVPWDQLNGDMSRALRDFQTAARAELQVDSAEPAATGTT